MVDDKRKHLTGSDIIKPFLKQSELMGVLLNFEHITPFGYSGDHGVILFDDKGHTGFPIGTKYDIAIINNGTNNTSNLTVDFEGTDIEAIGISVGNYLVGNKPEVYLDENAYETGNTISINPSRKFNITVLPGEFMSIGVLAKQDVNVNIVDAPSKHSCMVLYIVIAILIVAIALLVYKGVLSKAF